MSLMEKWREFLGMGPGKGVYKYDGKGDLARHRFHLRIDSESKGVLLIDASNIVYLNGTAVDYVNMALQDRSDMRTAHYMQHRYKNLLSEVAIQDYHEIRNKLVKFVNGEMETIGIIGPESMTYGSDDFPAPYRMDLVLTYKCQNQCDHCYNEPRKLEEYSVDQWKKVIGKLWDLGIPHIVFTGGEPTMYDGLDELVSQSELFGQVTGLITNGRKLGEPGFLHDLVVRGLDHVQITVLSYKESEHDRLVGEEGAWKETIEGLKTALKEDMYVNTNTTIMRSNLEDIEETMRFLVSLGVKNIAFNSIIRSGKGKNAEALQCEELSPMITKLQNIADESKVKLIWYSPTPYCEFNPINHGLGIKQCTACSLNMAIEPDGTVLPCQSYYKPLGNILRDRWETIWQHDLCKNIRERKYLDEECMACGMKDTCGGGCPLAAEYGDYVCLDRHSSV